MRRDRKRINECEETPVRSLPERVVVIFLCLLMLIPGDWALLRANAQVAATMPEREAILPDSTTNAVPDLTNVALTGEATDSIPPTEVVADDYTVSGKIPFNPSPTRAVWLSALCPGLGQIYNRRYWKLPIVIGGFMGLGYATNWNNNQYQDYMQGYRDLLDSDPATNSYMDFFAPTVSESDLNMTWVQSTFKTRKDYYRRYRDLCIILLVAFYALCMVDAYVDASMAHFDISPNLSLDWSPTLLEQKVGRGSPAIGLNWALTF